LRLGAISPIFTVHLLTLSLIKPRMPRGISPMIVDLDRDTIKTGLETGSIVVVDVRETHEYEAGHIPGSISMPLSVFDPAELPHLAGQRIVLSCAAGVRSMQAAMLARSEGVNIDAHYRGGFKDWIMAGERVERG
jgi:rhodanese-related sulfurtransferase